VTRLGYIEPRAGALHNSDRQDLADTRVNDRGGFLEPSKCSLTTCRSLKVTSSTPKNFTNVPRTGVFVLATAWLFRPETAVINDSVRIITVIFLTTLPYLTIANEDSTTSLEHQRYIYSVYTADNFDDGGPISRHVWKNFPAFYGHTTIAHTGPERPLPQNARVDVADFKLTLSTGNTTLANYIETNPYVDGMIVLHGGDIVFEAYPNMQPHDRHIGWSVTKVVTSSALAVLERQGLVDMDSLVENYVPSLSDSHWSGTSVRDIANMASGMDCLDSDGYQNTESCVYRLEESLDMLARHNPRVDNLTHMRSIKRKRPAGEINEYVSANTHVLGLIIENVSEMPLAEALKNLIWDRIGAEADGMMVTSLEGISAPHGGLSARLRDIARFGQIHTPGANLDVVGSDHFADLRSNNGIRFSDAQLQSLSETLGDELPTNAAWQWDLVWADGVRFKSGYSGQGLFVDPNNDVVIAFFGTAGENNEEHELTAISHQLIRSDLFD